MNIRLSCGYCQWTEMLITDASRGDQTAYNAIWQHVAAAHWTQSRELRTLGIRERKEALLSWTTNSSPTSSSTASSTLT